MTSLFNCCCCGCEIAENVWTDVSSDETFEYMRNVTTATTTLTNISDDGTTLGCKNYDASKSMTTPLIEKEFPCLDVNIVLVHTMLTPPAYDPGGGFIQTFNQDSTYVFGQILPATAITPNGYAVTVNMTIDWAARYRETTANATGSTTVAYDATVPTVTANYGRNPALAARQGGQIFLLRSGFSVVEGRTGLQYTTSADFPSNEAGDWYRLVASNAPYGFNVDLSASGLLEVYNGTAFVPDSLDFCEGADPIEFGWYVQQSTSQQTQYVGTSGVLIDLRTSAEKLRLRIDRLCINTIQGDAAECAPACCDDPPATITVSIVPAGSGICYAGSGSFTLPQAPLGGNNSRWAGDDDESTAWIIQCADGVWSTDCPDSNLTIASATTQSCDPFQIVFTKTTGSCIGTVITVTA